MKIEFDADRNESSEEGSSPEDHDEHDNHDENESFDHEDETDDKRDEVNEEPEDYEPVPPMRIKNDNQKPAVMVNKAAEDDEEDDDAYDDDEDVTDEDDNNLLIKPLPVPPKHLSPKMTAKIRPAPKNNQKSQEAARTTRPSTQQMVDAAIKTLNERSGSSVAAIIKFLLTNYPHVDSAKVRVYIKKYIKSGVASGRLIQTKGIGATGSFKLSAKGDEAKKAKKEQKTEKGKEKKKTAQKKQEKGIKKSTKETTTKSTAKAKSDAKQPKLDEDAAAAASALKTKALKKEPTKKPMANMPTKKVPLPTKKSTKATTDDLSAQIKPTSNSEKPKLQRKLISNNKTKQPPLPKTAATGKAITAMAPIMMSPAKANKRGAIKKVVAPAAATTEKSKSTQREMPIEVTPIAAVAAVKPSSKAKRK